MSDEFIPLPDHIERISELCDKMIGHPEFADAVNALEDCLVILREINEASDMHRFFKGYSRFFEVYETHKAAWDRSFEEE